jgi:tetratricopeptide (TPR) repeat protein
LRATIAWSYGLLAEEEAAWLRALAVFDATFDMAAICSVTGGPEAESLRVVEALVMKSLVWTDPAPTSVRYALATTVREFLNEIVAKDGSLSGLRRRHFTHYHRHVAGAIPASLDSDAKVDLSVLDAEISNVRGALSWALEMEPLEGAGMVALLARYWKSRGFLREGRQWFGRYLASERVGGSLRASLLRRAATFATEQDDYDEAQALSQESHVLFERSGDIGGTAEALHNLAVIEQRRGNLDEAMTYYESAIEKFREAKKTREESIVLYNLALLAFSRGQVSESERLIHDATRVATVASEEVVLANATQSRATLALERGRLEDAEALLQQAAEASTRLGNRFDYAETQDALSLVYVRQGRFDEATVAARECLKIGLEIDAASLLVYGLEASCEIAINQGRFEDAALYLRASKKLRDTHRYRHVNARNISDLEATVRAHLSDRSEILDRTDDLDVRNVVGELVAQGAWKSP